MSTTIAAALTGGAMYGESGYNSDEMKRKIDQFSALVWPLVRQKMAMLYETGGNDPRYLAIGNIRLSDRSGSQDLRTSLRTQIDQLTSFVRPVSDDDLLLTTFPNRISKKVAAGLNFGILLRFSLRIALAEYPVTNGFADFSTYSAFPSVSEYPVSDELFRAIDV